jgi:hypothetical protein
LEQNPDKIRWDWLSTNPNAISLLEKNPKKINWYNLSKNPNIFEYDYDFMKTHFLSTYGKELIQWQYHPTNQNK